MNNKPHDLLVPKIEGLARAKVSGSATAVKDAEATLHTLNWAARKQRVRPEMQAVVFRRDAFRCCYCGVKTFPLPILELLELPFTRGWLGGETHEAFLLVSCCDHIMPVSRGGTSSHDNLVTACWRCNTIKAEFALAELGWNEPTKGPRPSESWRGLTEHYEVLWEAAGRPDPPRHERWFRAFAAADGARPSGFAAHAATSVAPPGLS
jgi:hypothetical protein